MARSRLYRIQILQVNIRWKALDEIYKMYMLFCTAQTSIFQKFFVKCFRIFWQNLQKFVIFEFFWIFSLIFAQIFMKFCRYFADKSDKIGKISDKIENVENRLLLFDPQILHSSSTTSNAKGRFNININYLWKNVRSKNVLDSAKSWIFLK